MAEIGMRKKAKGTFDEVLARLPEALKAEGFGVLTRIDVHDTLKAKIGVDFRKYVILGACNPTLAHRALQAETEIGLLLPCNVVVYADDVPGYSVVVAMDPVAALALTGNDAVRPIAADVKSRLQRALESVERG